MTSARAALASLFFCAAAAPAGLLRSWTLSELEKAPLLAVCVVEDVAAREPAAPEAVRWSGSYRWQEATLLVERVHSTLPLAPAPGDRIVVRYIGLGDTAGGISGSPVWPLFKKGQRAVFPLLPSKDRPDRWSLFADEGLNITVPAIEKAWRRTEAPSSPGAFLATELINTLANGSPGEQFAASQFLRERSAVPAGARPLLDAAIGDDEERWLSVAAALVCSLGVPRPRVDEILSAAPVDERSPTGPVLTLLAHALGRSGQHELPDRLIVRLIDDAPFHAWGSAATLVEFKDSPVLVERLRDALGRHREGAVTIAWFLVRNGQHAVLPEALAAAGKLVMDPGPAGMYELQSASALIRDYGDDAQFAAIVATLRRLKIADIDGYRKLFSSASYSENKREIALAAVLLDDPREGFPPMRFCDVAAAALQRASGQDFGVAGNMTRSDWDRAVGRARAWLAQQH